MKLTLTILMLLFLIPVSVENSNISMKMKKYPPNPFGSACSEYECSLHWMGVDYCKGAGESVQTPACTFTCWCGDSGDCLWWTSDC